MGKQAKTQTSYWDKQKPFTNAHIHKQCTVIEKKHKDKLLRQLHTYIVCSQKQITNAHIHKQCTVRKTQRQAIYWDKCTPILYAHKSW